MDARNAPFAVGVDIGGTKTCATLWRATEAEEAFICLEEERFPTGGTPDGTIARVTGTIRSFLHGHGLSGEDVAGIGVSCGGPLDATAGIILSPPNLPGWDAIHITDILREATGIPAFLENDANACALAEWRWGAGRGYDNLIFMTFGTGMGAGMILDGKLYRGATGMAGEIGHMGLASKGPAGYGKSGSFEGFCSGSGISGAYHRLTGERKAAREIFDLARCHDTAAMKVISASARYLGRGLSILIDILNPDCIVIGSIFERNEDLFRPIMEKILRREALEQSRLGCVIKPAGLGDDIGNWAALGIVADRKAGWR